MSTINLRYPVYAPIDCIRMDWPIGPTTKNLKEALASPYPMAVLPVMFNDSHMWCYDHALSELDLTQFGLIILSDIEFESVRGIQAWAKRNRIVNYVLATGKIHKVRDILNIVSQTLDYEITFEGKDSDEIMVDSKSGGILVQVAHKYRRRFDEYSISGDTSKFSKISGWRTRVTFEELISEMAKFDEEIFYNLNKNGVKHV